MNHRENLSDNPLRTARLFLSASGVDTHLMSDAEVAIEVIKRRKPKGSDGQSQDSG